MACTDPEMGKLLHAYELGQLSEKEKTAFEVHLISCESCFTAVAEFSDAASLLRGDPDVRAEVEEHVRSVVPQASFWQRLGAALWPSQVPILARPAVAYLLFALMLYPAYLGLRGPSGEAVTSVAAITLSGTRSVGTALESGQTTSVTFRVPGNAEDATFRIDILNDDASVVRTIASLDQLNERRQATIVVSQGSLQPGSYTLRVTSLRDSSVSIRYPFVVVE